MKSTAMDEMIKNVVEVVFYSKYYYITDPDLKEDLIQEGNLAAYTLLASGEYNPTKDLRNYMYSWVWNAMSNYLYKQKKEKWTDLDSIENLDILGVTDRTQSIYSFDAKIIYDICKKYEAFGDYYNEVLIYLQEIGLIKNYVPKESIGINAQLKITVIGQVLYRIFEEVDKNGF